MHAGGMTSRIAALVLVLVCARAGVAGETARQILDRRKALEDTSQHWNDRHQRMKLRIIDHRGGERLRELEVYDRRESGDERKTILFFLTPAEVKGTGFLSFTHKGRAADQWLYLPELQRVRQITARTRNESFVGTDLSYHDLDLLQEMTSWTEADATSKLRDDETIGGGSTHLIELTPQREDIGYHRIVLWLRTEDPLPPPPPFYEDPDPPHKPPPP